MTRPIPPGGGTVPDALIVTTANVARRHRYVVARYTRRLRRITKRVARRTGATAATLARQEVGRGTESTRLAVLKVRPSWRKRARRAPATDQRWRVVGVGAHNGVAWRDIEWAGLTVRVMSAHGLHLRTVGRVRQATYYAELREWINDFPEHIDAWVIGADFNRRHDVIARYLGGASVGEGVDGVVVSAGLRVELERVVRVGLKKRWTDHPAVVARVTRRTK